MRAIRIATLCAGLGAVALALGCRFDDDFGHVLRTPVADGSLELVTVDDRYYVVEKGSAVTPEDQVLYTESVCPESAKGKSRGRAAGGTSDEPQAVCSGAVIFGFPSTKEVSFTLSGAVRVVMKAKQSHGLAITVTPSPEVYEDTPGMSRDAAAEGIFRLVLEDGVSREEAQAIAYYFFYAHSGVGCGAPDQIRETADAWHVGTHIGYAATRDADIIVLKRDGSLSWKGRCVSDPFAMLEPGFFAPLCGEGDPT